MAQENFKLTAIQTDYKQHVANREELRDATLSRITQIRKEINVLHAEEGRLELIRDVLINEVNLK